MDSILITGSNGFLGSSLLEFFKNNKKIYSISHGHPKQYVHNLSSDILSIREIPKEISNVFHFAALTDIQFCEKNPIQCLEINVKGTKNMLELARKTDSTFIFPSTSHVFGQPEYLPIDESCPIKPLTIHAKSKAECEIMCKQYSESYGLKVIILRLFSIYGNNSPHYSIIFKIIYQILKEKKIRLGNIKAKRDFLHIDDFLSAINVLTTTKLNNFSIFNIGYGSSYSIEEVCNKLLEISEKKLAIESRPELLRKNDVDELLCDNTKIRSLGWSPMITIDTGLLRAYGYIKSTIQ